MGSRPPLAPAITKNKTKKSSPRITSAMSIQAMTRAASTNPEPVIQPLLALISLAPLLAKTSAMIEQASGPSPGHTAHATKPLNARINATVAELLDTGYGRGPAAGVPGGPAGGVCQPGAPCQVAAGAW